MTENLHGIKFTVASRAVKIKSIDFLLYCKDTKLLQKSVNFS